MLHGEALSEKLVAFRADPSGLDAGAGREKSASPTAPTKDAKDAKEVRAALTLALLHAQGGDVTIVAAAAGAAAGTTSVSGAGSGGARLASSGSAIVL